MTDDEFEGHVTDALDSIPASLLDLLENCVIVVEDEPPADEPDLLGVYDGVPLTERDHEYGAVLPDRIVIFKNPTLRMCQTREEVVEEVGITVVHEIAHYFGIDDARLREMGY